MKQTWYILTLLLLTVGSGEAQTFASTTPVVQQLGTSHRATRIDVKIQRMPLADAIQAIAQQSGLPVIFAPDKLPTARTVTYSATQVTGYEALSAILQGSGFRTETLLDGSVKVVRAGGQDVRRTGTIVGKVVQAKTRQPVTNATIVIGGGTQSISVSGDGTFRIPAEAGEQVVHVRGVGFVRQVKRVTVVEGETVTVEIVLEPSANVLDEVVVTGSVVATERKAITTPITVITADDILKRGITRIDQLFRGEIPGLLAIDRGVNVYVDSIGAMSNAALYSRGSSDQNGGPSPVKIYIDGVAAQNSAALGLIDPASIERIEIVTGPQAATIYGSGAMGGVMQVFTKRGSGMDRMDFTLRAQYGLLQTNLSNGLTPSHVDNFGVVGGSGPGFSYQGNVSYRYTGQWQPALFSEGYGVSVGVTHRKDNVSFAASYGGTRNENGTYAGGNTSGNGWQSSLTIQNRIQSGEYTPDGAGVYAREGVQQRVSHSSGQTLSLNVDYLPLSFWQHHLVIGRSQSAGEMVPEAPNFKNPSDTLFKGENNSGYQTTMGYNTTLMYPRSRFFSLTSSIGIDGASGSQTSMNGCYPVASSTQLIECSPSQPLVANKNNTNDAWGGFGSWQLGLFDQVFFRVGLRGERNSLYGSRRKVDWTPTYGMTYTIEMQDITVKLLSSYGRATRPPRASAKLDTWQSCNPILDPCKAQLQKGNLLLRPEVERGGQGGVELYFGNIGSLTINHYVQHVDDLVESIVIDSTRQVVTSINFPLYTQLRQQINIGSVQKRGWEGTVSATWGPLSAQGSYSWNDSRLTRTTLGSQYPVGMQLGRGIPTHFGNVSISYATGGSNMALQHNVFGKARMSCGGVEVTSGRFFDLGVNGTWHRHKMYVLHYQTEGVAGSCARAGYSRTNITASHRLRDWMSLTANITNLGNAFNSDVGFLSPTLGRQTLLGLSLRYPQR